MIRLAAWAVVCLTLAGCAATRTWISPLEAKGRAFAVETCGSCHYVEGEAAKPLNPALPFREMGRLYGDVSLDSQIEQIGSRGHHDVPSLEINDGQRRALIAYIAQLRP